MIIKKVKPTQSKQFTIWFGAAAQLAFVVGILLGRLENPKLAFFEGLLLGFSMVGNLYLLTQTRHLKDNILSEKE